MNHFRTQDWIAVFVDFLIVVVGIFVGLQVDQWNQERKERILETQYLLSMKSDLEADIAELDRTIALAKGRAESGRDLLESIREKRIKSDANKFVMAVYDSLLLNYPSYTRATMDELLSTGNLRLIRSDALKSDVAEYYATVYRHEQFMPNWRAMQIALEHTFPSILDFHVREAGHLVYMGGPEWISREFDFTASKAKAILDRITEHPLAKGQIENMVRIQDSQYINLIAIREKAIQVAESL